MNFPRAIGTCFRKYATFTGRAQRSEFWFFCLYYSLTLYAEVLALRMLPTTFGYALRDPKLAPIALLLFLFMLGNYIPLLAVTSRRIRDTGASGWFALLHLVPFVGIFIVMIWCLIPGKRGTNQYGPDPLGGDIAQIRAEFT